ncbi:transmembrane protein 222-like [Ptychodera flava]|uniref:transmembrane protein 222-like n=1 Tax=Ptychodera flava TaxID=63121 RepID=UPI003969BF85
MEVANVDDNSRNYGTTSNSEVNVNETRPNQEGSMSESKISMYSESSYKIDKERCRYPYSIVWTPIPCLTWILPFIGHMGICMSSGIIRDFAGPYYVSVSQFLHCKCTNYLHKALFLLRALLKACRVLLIFISSELNHTKRSCMAFGTPTRYLQLKPSNARKDNWDTAVLSASEEYKHRMHNLCCDNCHSHVAMALNMMQYNGSTSWNMVKLCFLIFVKAKYVNFLAIIKQWLPFTILVAVIVCLAVVL